MKRALVLTTAFVLGCQGSGTQRVGRLEQPVTSPAMKRRDLQPVPYGPDGPVVSREHYDPEVVAAGYDPAVVRAGFDHGPGAKRNMAFVKKVARAIPSYGPLPDAPPPPHGGPGAQATSPGLAFAGCGPQWGAGEGMGLAGGPAPQLVGLAPRFTTGRTQVRFVKPVGMKIAWESAEAGGFTAPQLETPARYNFAQAQIYRLKLTELANRPGLELYPTIEVYPGNVKVNAYLSHNAVPIEFSDEDFDQVQAGNYVTKVIYLPDPQFQELAIAGVETLVSTRLDPGVDPVQEAHRRGAILVVVRLGSVDLEMPHSPPLLGEAMGYGHQSDPLPVLRFVTGQPEGQAAPGTQ